MEQPARLARARAIGPIGTIARICVGVLMIGVAVSGEAGDGVGMADALLVLGGAGVLLAWQFVLLRSTSDSLNATGPIAFTVNAMIAAALFSVEATREAALIFYGASMWLAAVRGYAGCEVLAISNWLLRRDDQVGCVVFSPLDAAERAMSEEDR